MSSCSIGAVRYISEIEAFNTGSSAHRGPRTGPEFNCITAVLAAKKLDPLNCESFGLANDMNTTDVDLRLKCLWGDSTAVVNVEVRPELPIFATTPAVFDVSFTFSSRSKCDK